MLIKGDTGNDIRNIGQGVDLTFYILLPDNIHFANCFCQFPGIHANILCQLTDYLFVRSLRQHLAADKAPHFIAGNYNRHSKISQPPMAVIGKGSPLLSSLRTNAVTLFAPFLPLLRGLHISGTEFRETGPFGDGSPLSVRNQRGDPCHIGKGILYPAQRLYVNQVRQEQILHLPCRFGCVHYILLNPRFSFSPGRP